MPELPACDLSEVVAQIEPLWKELRGGRIFLTGATGFFGSWLLESFELANRLFELNASAVVLTRDPEAFRVKAPHLWNNPAIHYHRGDVREFSFPEGSFSHVIHGAGDSRATLAEDSPLLVFDTMTQGTRRVLDFCSAAGVKNLLFLSSGAVYGAAPDSISHVTEEYRGGPAPEDFRSGYAQGKRVAEFLCAVYSRKLEMQIAVARCFAFVGPNLPLDGPFAVGNFIRDALGGNPIRIQGDGTPVRSYLYAADLAVWLWTLLFRGGGTVFNVGSDEAITIQELAVKMAALAPSRVPVVVNEDDRNTAMRSTRYVPSIAKARELGLCVKTPLDIALRKTMAWYAAAV